MITKHKVDKDEENDDMLDLLFEEKEDSYMSIGL
jgi:hypothetical protein